MLFLELVIWMQAAFLPHALAALVVFPKQRGGLHFVLQQIAFIAALCFVKLLHVIKQAREKKPGDGDDDSRADELKNYHDAISMYPSAKPNTMLPTAIKATTARSSFSCWS